MNGGGDEKKNVAEVDGATPKGTPCEICGKRFATPESLARHRDLHSRFQRHKIVHHSSAVRKTRNEYGECGALFADRRQLVRHVGTYQREILSCSFCASTIYFTAVEAMK